MVPGEYALPRPEIKPLKGLCTLPRPEIKPLKGLCTFHSQSVISEPQRYPLNLFF